MLNVKDAKAFEEFLDAKESNVIGIGYKPSDLRGIGTEYLIANGVIVAKFFNGNMIQTVLTAGNQDKTLVSE